VPAFHTHNAFRTLLLAGFQLAVTVLLETVPFISATSSPSQPHRRGLHFRDLVVQQRDVLPQGWSSLGCYTDDPSRPTLTSVGNRDQFNMTVENCVRFCDSRYNIYAGVENGEDCYCGNVTTVGSKSAPPKDCSSKCVGDISETCGGSNRLNLYWNGEKYPLLNLPLFKRDSNDARVLTEQAPIGQYNTSVEGCTDACNARNYSLAGLEFAQQCWCDNSINNGGAQIDSTHCMLACSGNSSEICGGANSLVIYSTK
ncbi:WSC domain-containing protein, partial [Lactarius psammicola]